MGGFKNVLKCIKWILIEVGAIIVALLIYIIALFLTVLIPLFIYRYCVCQIAKKFKPELGKMLAIRSALFSVDDTYNGKPLLNIVVTVVMEGDLEIEKLRNVFEEKVLNLKFPNGEIAFPEMKQYMHPWGGYMFWKDVKNFNLSNHIKCWEGNKNSEGLYEVLDDRQYRDIVRDLTFKEYSPNGVLWEMVLLKNYQPKFSKPGVNYSAFIFRLHHCLGDGYSALNLLMVRLGDSSREKVAKPKYVERSRLKTFLFVLSSFLKCPYEAGKLAVTVWDKNIFVGPVKNVTRENSIAISDRIPLELIREIRKIHNVSFSSVISASIVGGMRNFMLKRKLKVPATAHCTLPLPMQGHSEKLRNTATCGLVVYPLGISDPVKRLKFVNHQFEKLRFSSLLTVLYYLQPIAGVIPFKLLRCGGVSSTPTTAALTNFPGPTEKISLVGNEVVDVFFCQGFGPNSLSLSFGALSSFGMIKIGVAIDRCIFPTDEDADELLACIMEELDILKNQDIRV